MAVTQIGLTRLAVLDVLYGVSLQEAKSRPDLSDNQQDVLADKISREIWCNIKDCEFAEIDACKDNEALFLVLMGSIKKIRDLVMADKACNLIALNG